MEMYDLAAIDVLRPTLSHQGKDPKWASDLSEWEDVNEWPEWIRQAWFASYSAWSSFHALEKNKGKYLGNVAIQIKQKCFVMYVAIREGAYILCIAKCPSRELFQGEARCRQTWQRDSGELCAAHQCLAILFPSLYNTVETRPSTSAQRSIWLAAISMDHFSTAYYSCHYLLLLIKSIAWQFVYHLTKWGLARGEQSRAHLTFHYLSCGQCERPEKHRRTISLVRHIFLHQLIVYSMWQVQIQREKTQKATKQKRSLLFSSLPFSILWHFHRSHESSREARSMFCWLRGNIVTCFQWWISAVGTWQFSFSPKCFSFLKFFFLWNMT